MSLTRREKSLYEARDKLIEGLASECECFPISDRPCAGLLAGGLCDNLHIGMEAGDDDEYNEPDDL